jgi:hypothetical protein
MGWVIAGTMIVLLLSIALVVDLKDRGRGGKRAARRLGDARRDVVPNPQVGGQGSYLNLP